MSEWNLSVNLRGQGSDLAKALRSSAKRARTLANAVDDAQSSITGLNTASRTAGASVRTLGRRAKTATRAVRDLASSSTTAAAGITGIGTQAAAAAKKVRKLERALATADAQIRAMDTHIQITADLDDRTATGLAATRSSLADLQRLDPVTIGVDLDDRTGPRAATVRAALDTLQQASPLTLSVALDDDTGPGLAAVHAAVADLQALSPVTIATRFDGDPAQILAAAAAMRDLRDDAGDTGDRFTTLAAQSAAVAAALQTVQDAARDTSRALRTLRGRAAATADALDDLRDRADAAAAALNTFNGNADTTNTRLGDLSTRARTLRGDMDDLDGAVNRTAGRLGGLQGSLGTLNQAASNSSGRMRQLIIAAIALGSALIPVAAALVPIATALTAAGVAAGAFGLAIGGQIMLLADAFEAHEKYEEAVREHGKASEEAAKAENEYLHQLEQMPPATREAAAAVTDLKDAYGDWSNELSSHTMPAVTQLLQLLSMSLPKTTRLAQAAGSELNHLTAVAAGAMNTPGFDRMMQRFEEFASRTLSRATTGMVDFATALDTGEVGADYREFMAYVRENGPLVADTLKNLAEVAVNVLVGFSDLGVSVLTVVNALAELVNAVPTGAVSAFVQMYVALKLLQLGMAGIAAVASSGAAAAVATFFRAVAFGGLGSALSGIATRMTGVHRAALRLGILAVAAVGIKELAEYARGAPPDVDRLTTSLKRLAQTGKATGEFRKTFGDVDGLVDKIKQLQGEMQKLEESQGAGTGVRVPVLDDIAEAVSGAIQDMTKGADSLNALEDDFKAVDQALAGMASGGHADTAAEAFNRLREAAAEQGIPVKELNALFPQYQDTLAAIKVEQQLAADGMGLFGQQALETKSTLDAQRQSADGLRQAIQALNDVNRAGLGGMIGFEEAIDAAAKAARKNAGTLSMSGGVLDLNSEKARTAATALNDLATRTDEAAGAARESGANWETVNGIYERGRAQLVASARQMGLTKTEANRLADSILTIPDKKEVGVEMRTDDAIAGLDAVIAKIRETPGAKSVKVDALTRDAILLLESLGYKVKRLPDGRFKVTAETGAALSGIGAVQAARDRLKDKTVTITTMRRTIFESVQRSGGSNQAAKNAAELGYARGGVVDYYARGGITRQRGGVRSFAGGAERHVAQFAPAGSWRVWAEPETGGEAYIPLAASKRGRSRVIAEETVRRLGGDPAGIAWMADGGLNFSYAGTGRAADRYTLSGLIGASNDKKGNFSLSIFYKKLRTANNGLDAWRRNLATVANRAGQDVADALAAMGDDGIELTKKMATGSSKYLKQMAAEFRNLAGAARASLGEYTTQLNGAVKDQETFARNLATLAGRGYGDLARQLAAQGDQAASELAAAAVKDKKKASAADKAAQRAGGALSADQLEQLVAIIAAVKTSKTGIHDVAAATGLGEDVIIDVANRAKAQIAASLGARAAKLLTDLGKANRGLAYANGGIREGIYATRGGLVRFAEPSTGGEAYIPLGANKRPGALRVLGDVASRFGVGITDGQSPRVVVVREQGPLIREQHWHIASGSGRDLARDLEARNAYQLRRLARGGTR